MVVSSWTIDDDVILINSGNGSFSIDVYEYCEWYNDTFKNWNLFKPLQPENINDLDITPEDLKRYFYHNLNLDIQFITDEY